ncbi:MAG: septum formation protein Maf [Firmicutes bacterium]|nr:septum formation protein Maf [Bacillota bacterium]
MFDKKDISIVLASASPRRRELLGLLTEDFEIEVSQAEDEAQVPRDLPVKEHPGFFAKVKAEDIARSHPDKLVIGSDTGVLVEDENGELQMLGKPVDEADARRMLRMLSGKWHYISTGCCICYKGKSHVFVEVAEVEMYELTEKEIDDYLAVGEHVDKAGAYAIQGYGALLIKGMKGNFQTVVGLPVARLKREMEKVIING